MKHNKYFSNMLAVTVAAACALSVHAYSNLPFHALDPPGGSFRTYVTAIQRRRRRRFC
ncbi:MAG: hypothetical protein ACI4WS_06615 [Oscillospiraceae bacterium]